MVEVKRTDIYGGVGFKTFSSLSEATKWLNSDSVKKEEV
jgi:hypothetical protein